MPTPTILPIETLHKLLAGDPDAGTLHWRERPLEFFEHCKAPKRICAAWNARLAGKEAFTTDHRKGYRRGMIFGRSYLAHRVIWALTTGAWPPEEIDHINGVKDDNRIENLRAVTRAENLRNQAIYSNNTSGVVGVDWHKRDKRWTAQIRVDNKQIYLGYFTNKEDAIAARAAADIEYGFHANHGRAPCQS